MAHGRFVSYYRVSTEKQGRAGLGMEAQKSAVSQFLNGGSWTLLDEFTEVESGGRNDRPELEKAMAACRMKRATLVIAKLDRLARNAHFLLGLQKAGVEFVCADMPDANRLTVSIMAMVAEQERTMISARTKAALAAAKARGTKLGVTGPQNIRNQKAGAASSARVRSAKADDRARDLAREIEAIRAEGVTSANGTARRLNERDVKTARGKDWSAVQVQLLLQRIAGLNA